MGTISEIIKEARKQTEYHDIDLLRHTSIKLREEGLELFRLSFAIRINNLMNENGLNEDQLEIIISDFATYCFKNNLSYDEFIRAGLKALELADEFGIDVKLLSEYLTQAKTKLETSEQQRQEKLNQIINAQKELDTILAEIERYGGEKPLIEQIRSLEKEVKETRRSEEYMRQRLEACERRWQRESGLALRLQRENEELNRKLVSTQEDLDKLREETGWYSRNLREKQKIDVDY